jgi:hypothetical protein
MSAAGMLDLSGAHGAAAAANAITSNRFSYSMNLKVPKSGQVGGDWNMAIYSGFTQL